MEEGRDVFAHSFESKEDALEFCRRAKRELKHADRVELMHTNHPAAIYPWTCVVEGPEIPYKDTTILDYELVELCKKPGVPPTGEVGLRGVEMLKREGQFLISREVWNG
jgi:hypothetical protein